MERFGWTPPDAAPAPEHEEENVKDPPAPAPAFESAWEYEWAKYGKPASLSATAAKAIAYGCLTAAPAPEPTRSQKLREAGFTRRPTWKSLPSDNMDDEPAPDAATVDQIMALADEYAKQNFDDGWNQFGIHGDESVVKRARVRAAVERVIAENEAAVKVESDLRQYWFERAERAEAERDALKELLLDGRKIVERAGTAKLADGTYFDANCACTLWLARMDAALAKHAAGG